MTDLPQPCAREKPTRYADRVGEWYVAQKSDHDRKRLGLYFTPIRVAEFMCGKLRTNSEKYRLLDPSAGAGILICAAIESFEKSDNRPKEIDIVAHEVDPQLLPVLGAVLTYLSEWCQQELGITLTASVFPTDFVLARGDPLRFNDTLLQADSADEQFDLIIANPPYFKISKHDPRAKAVESIVYGQPNIYALFMAVSATLLRQNGNLIFIVPRSFASGQYFLKFRTMFFQMIRPAHLHLFGSRRETFCRDDVLQENIILFGTKEARWHQTKAQRELTLTSSAGGGDLDSSEKHVVPIDTALNLESPNKALRLPLTSSDEATLAVVDSWPSRLADFGLEISTGPVVPFRSKSLVEENGSVSKTHVPLLWMNHVRAMEIRWPLNGQKKEFIRRTAPDVLLVPNRNYVLLRRFSAKEEVRRLTAAPYISDNFNVPNIGLENHLNYIHRPGGELDEDEAWGFAALFSSRLFNSYFRITNGNTQVSATELRAFPLPPLDTIALIGRSMRTLPDPLTKIDAIASVYLAQRRPKEAPHG